MTDERSQIAALQRAVASLRRRIEFVEGSRFWSARGVWVRGLARLGLSTSEPSIPARDFTETMEPSDAYTRWLLTHEPRHADLERFREVGRRFAYVPSIAIIVDDVGATDDRASDAVRKQAYEATALLRTSAAGAAGLPWQRFNAALAECRADVVAFCEPTSFLAPHATFEAALGFNLDVHAVAVYGDRDVIEPDGSRRNPKFTPDWSPDTLLSEMYMGELVFYRRDAVERCGGFRPESGAALHYDLALRVLDDDSRVVHRPAILVHESSRTTFDDAAEADAVRVVREVIARRGEPGIVTESEHPRVHIVRYAQASRGVVEVIVPTRDLPDMLERCLQSVFEKNPACDFSVTIVDNGSVDPRTAGVVEAVTAHYPGRVRVLRIDEPFNFSRLVNAAARDTDATYLLLLNNDAYFLSDDGIAALREQASRASIGAVGARLLYGDGSIQHAGVVVGIGGLAGHVHRFASAQAVKDSTELSAVRNYSAVTAACMMVRRSSFELAGGFEERLAVEYNDVDFCMRLRKLGLRNVYLPHVVVRHDESSSRRTAIVRPSVTRAEQNFFRRTWSSDEFVDPYYNRNLTREREDGSIAS